MPVTSRQRGGKCWRLPCSPLGKPGWGKVGGSRGSGAAVCPCPTSLLHPSTSTGSRVAQFALTLLCIATITAPRRWWHWGQAVLTTAVSSAGFQPVAPTLPGDVHKPEVFPTGRQLGTGWALQPHAVGWPVGAGCCSRLKVPQAGQGQHWFAQSSRARFGSFMVRAGRAELRADLSRPILSHPVPSLLVPAQPQRRGKPMGGFSLQPCAARPAQGGWHLGLLSGRVLCQCQCRCRCLDHPRAGAAQRGHRAPCSAAGLPSLACCGCLRARCWLVLRLPQVSLWGCQPIAQMLPARQLGARASG